MYITKEEHRRLYEPWNKALIVKLLGKNLRPSLMEEQLRRIWKPKGTMFITDLGNFFYVIKLYDDLDYERAIFGGPWLISNHYLTIQCWVPNFDVDAASISKIAVWVCVPKFPLEFFDKESLSKVGNAIGKTLRVDETTLFTIRCQYAKIGIEIDLSKPLQSKIWFSGKLCHLEYEGLHAVCFTCVCMVIDKKVAQATKVPRKQEVLDPKMILLLLVPLVWIVSLRKRSLIARCL